jgi:hypothetical protein
MVSLSLAAGTVRAILQCGFPVGDQASFHRSLNDSGALAADQSSARHDDTENE